MSRTEEILVGVDGSESSLLALEWALHEAERRGWPVRVVCCYSIPSFSAASLDGGYAALDDSTMKESAAAALEIALSRVRERGIAVAGSLEAGDAAGVLIAASAHAGLVVVGTRGSGGFTDRLLGTVSSALPAHAHCPVVIVPTRSGQVSRFIPQRRIVVGMDGSASSKVALEYAISQAALWDGELTVVAGVPMAQGTGMLPWLPAVVDRGQVLADVESAMEQRVSEALGESGVRPKVHALDGSGAALLTEFSTVVELVVVGSRGRGGFAGMLLGSTSQSVLHHASCPVMVVPARVEDEGFSPSAPPWMEP